MLAQNSPGKSTTHSRRNFLPTTGILDPPAGTPLATAGPKKLPTTGNNGERSARAAEDAGDSASGPGGPPPPP